MATVEPDPYAILGLDPSAPPALLDAAYFQMRLRHRHDPERLAEIEAAYHMLIDPEQRQAYAQRRAASLPPPPVSHVSTPEEVDAALARVATPSPVEPPPPAIAMENPTIAEAPWNYWDMAKAVAVVIVGTLAAGIPAALVANTFLDKGQDFEDDPTALSITLAVSFVLELLLLGTAIYFGPRKYKLPLAALGLKWPSRDLWFRVWFPVALAMAAFGISVVYFSVLSLFGVSPDPDVPDQVFDNAAPLAILVTIAVVFAPIMEEVFFRGFIFGGLRVRWGWVWAGIASAALFGLAHISNPGTVYVVVPIAGIGFLFAWARQYSGSISSSMIAHFIYNSISMAIGIAGSTIWLRLV